MSSLHTSRGKDGKTDVLSTERAHNEPDSFNSRDVSQSLKRFISIQIRLNKVAQSTYELIDGKVDCEIDDFWLEIREVQRQRAPSVLRTMWNM